MVAKINRMIDCLTILLYISLFMISSQSFNGQIISFGAASISVIIFASSAVLNGRNFSIKLTSFHLWMGTFILFCYISSFWAIQPDLSISKGNTILKNTICIVLVFFHYQHIENVKRLLKIIMYAGYILILLSVLFFGITSFTDPLTLSTRLKGDFLNQNVLGMLAAFTIVINIYFIIYYREQIYMTPVLALAVIVLAKAGSRKGIIELVVGIVLILMVKNYQKRRFFISLFKIIVIIFFSLVIIYFMSKLPIFDFIKIRLQNLINQLSGTGVIDESIRKREILNQLGFLIFKENPILGIGIDCARIPAMSVIGESFHLHNNYLELLADGGIVGFLCFYSIFIILFSRFIKFKTERTPEYDICLVLMTLHSVLEFSHVAYYKRETYFYLMLYYIASSIVKEQAKKKKAWRPIYGDV